MNDDFMNFMLLLDDDSEDEPISGEKTGCGCLPVLLAAIALVCLR